MNLPTREQFKKAVADRLAAGYIPTGDMPEEMVKVLESLGVRLPKGGWPGYGGHNMNGFKLKR